MGPAWVRPLIMMIFGAVSSWDARCCAYRATGTALGWMPGGGAGFVRAAGEGIRDGRMFQVDILPERASIRVI